MTSGEPCGRLLVGQGDDTYDPTCVLPARHIGRCVPELPTMRGRCLGCCAPGPQVCGGCGSYIDDSWNGAVHAR